MSYIIVHFVDRFVNVSCCLLKMSWMMNYSIQTRVHSRVNILLSVY